MPNLIGSGPNQCPTNADLGSMAFQNNEAVSIETLSLSSLTTNPTLSGGTANGVAYLNGSKVLTTGSALTFDGSNLGLGVTPSAWRSSEKAIQVGSWASLFTDSSVTSDIGYNTYISTGGSWTYVNNGYASRYSQYLGQHRWFTAPSGTAGNAISFTQAMTLDASGNLLFNSGYGSVAIAYGCRAWVNFNGTGTVAIRASGNVSSITDNGVGLYKVNFTTALPDVNYAVSGTCSEYGGNTSAVMVSTDSSNTLVGSVTIQTRSYQATFFDPTFSYVSIFR